VKTFQKKKPYRNRRLLNLAHSINQCQFQLPTCIGYQGHGCEPIHSDHIEHGKGIGIKADDDQHVAGCHECHLYYASGNIPKSERKHLFDEARERTFDIYEEYGLLGYVSYTKEFDEE